VPDCAAVVCDAVAGAVSDIAVLDFLVPGWLMPGWLMPGWLMPGWAAVARESNVNQAQPPNHRATPSVVSTLTRCLFITNDSPRIRCRTAMAQATTEEKRPPDVLDYQDKTKLPNEKKGIP
jgi:hypothetical protein